MFAITKPPRGLLDMLQLASMGEAPRMLEESMRATIEVSGMFKYTEYRNNESVPALTTPAAGFNPILTVGQNNILIPVNGGVFITLEAGRTASISLAVRLTNLSGNARVSPLGDQVAATAAVLARANLTPGPEIWLPSGAELGLLLENVTGGAPTAATSYGISLGNIVLRAGA